MEIGTRCAAEAAGAPGGAGLPAGNLTGCAYQPEPSSDGRTVSPVVVFSMVNRAGPGGVQGVLTDLTAGLRGRGVTLVEMTAGDCGIDGAEHCVLYLRESWRSVHLPSITRLGQLLARHRPKVVNVHFVGAETLYFLLLRRIFGYALVLTVHGSDLLRPEPEAARRLARFFRDADAVTAVSRDIRERLLETGWVDPGKVRVIANGVDCRFWSPARARDSGGPPRLVAVGRLEAVKGFDTLVAAAALLRDAGTVFDLEIIGDGSERNRLAALVAGHRLGGRVTFAGNLDRSAVRDRLRSADLYLMSSLSEGMPLALLEAMACGLPAVATDVGGVGEVLPQDAGRLVPPGSAEAIAGAIRAVLADPVTMRNAGHRARRRAEQFSVERKADEYIAAYAAGLDRRAGRAPAYRRDGLA